MAYRLEPEESVPESLTRCAQEQLDRAVRELEERIDSEPVGAVHAARKALKKERALLRLARGTLPRRQRERENAALREAARGLSGARDADVMIQTLDQLSQRYAGQLPETTFEAFRQRLDHERQSERGRMAGSSAAAAVADDLRAARMRVEDWKLERGNGRALESGLVRSYGRGRRAFVRAQSEPSLENLHQWRKRVKDLWYQLRLLAPVGGPAVRGQVKEAHRLADLLGDDHDLGVLRQTLLRLAPDLAVDHDALIGLLDHRREQLQTEARYVGERLYTEAPKAFGRRIARCWNAGRAQARAAQSQQPRSLAEVTHAGTGA